MKNHVYKACKKCNGLPLLKGMITIFEPNYDPRRAIREMVGG